MVQSAVMTLTSHTLSLTHLVRHIEVEIPMQCRCDLHWSKGIPAMALKHLELGAHQDGLASTTATENYGFALGSRHGGYCVADQQPPYLCTFQMNS